MSSFVVLRTDSSSSMTEIRFLASATLLCVEVIPKRTGNLLGVGASKAPGKTRRVMLPFTRLFLKGL